MAVQIWQNASILAGDFELGCSARNWDGPNASRTVHDTTTLCASGFTTAIAGRMTSTFSADVLTDYAAGTVDPEAFATLGVSQPVSVMPAGKTAGSLAYTWQTIPLEWTQTLANGELATGKISGVGSGVMVRGLVLADSATARTATANLTGQQLGTPSASQAVYAALHVLSASGTTPSCTVKLQSSTTLGGTYTDRITFAAATAPSSQWASLAGAVSGSPTFWRVSLTISGTTPSFSLAVVAGIATP
jgi:hypothetical protein